MDELPRFVRFDPQRGFVASFYPMIPVLLLMALLFCVGGILACSFVNDVSPYEIVLHLFE